jgi:hypothetical protein
MDDEGRNDEDHMVGQMKGKRELNNTKSTMILTSFISFVFLLLNIATAQGSGDGLVTGRILTIDGKPLSGGGIYFFDTTGASPFTHEYWRLAEYSAPLGDDGSFSTPIPAGTYYVMARKKNDPERIGPPQKGDLIYPPSDGREPKPCVVKASETMDMGTISEAVPLNEDWAIQGKTGIAGTVLDANGKPVEGRSVIASVSPSVGQLRFSALRRSGKDGKYVIMVPEDGQYYLVVMGRRDSLTSSAVTTGQKTEGVDIRFRVVPGSK